MVLGQRWYVEWYNDIRRYNQAGEDQVTGPGGSL